MYVSIIGSEDDVDENKTSREDTLDIVSTLDFRMNGSVENGTIRTIPKPVGKTNECSNEENSLPFALPRTASISDGSTKFSPRQNNLGFQRIPDEVPLLNNFYGNVDSNLEHAKSLQSVTASTTHDDKLTALQNKNCNFAPLHVECDPVSSSLNVLNISFILFNYIYFYFLYIFYIS